MAGLGAPDVSQVKTADVPSVTVMSEGGVVKDGDTPTMKTSELNNWKSKKYRGDKGEYAAFSGNCLALISKLPKMGGWMGTEK